MNHGKRLGELAEKSAHVPRKAGRSAGKAREQQGRDVADLAIRVGGDQARGRDGRSRKKIEDGGLTGGREVGILDRPLAARPTAQNDAMRPPAAVDDGERVVRVPATLCETMD